VRAKADRPKSSSEVADSQHALDVWGWENQDPQHRSLVLEFEDCKSRPTIPGEKYGGRIVYDVSGLSYLGDNQSTVLLDVRQIT